MKNKILILLTLFTTTQPFQGRIRNVFSSIDKLTFTERSILSNFCHLKFSKHKMPVEQYTKIAKEFDKQTQSTEMHSLTGGQFLATRMGSTMHEISELTKHPSFHKNNVHECILKRLGK